MRRRLALVSIAVLAFGCERHPPASAPAAPLNVVELSATDASARMAAGTLTSRALVDAYLARIGAIDSAGPRLNAIIEVNANAPAEADALDAERRAGAVRGPLHGVPVLVKDNIDMADMVNSAGSLALAEHRPAQDAFLITRLRAAGAIVLARTNLSEWANFRSTASTSGWSSRGGQTRNPYVLDRNPCGSSSGTGAGVAASLGAVGIGTETNGSILCPSAINGLVGLKPTVGVVSRSGIIPIAISQDTAGPMGRTVLDVALLMNALAGVDPRDPAGPAAAGRIPADYRAALRTDALAGRRFGALRQAAGYHPDVDASFDRAIERMRAAGAVIVDVTIPTSGDGRAARFELLLYEFKAGLNAYLRDSGAPHPSLQALIAWNAANAERAMPFFGQEIFERAQRKGPLSDPEYRAIRDKVRRQAGTEGLLAALARDRLDAVIAPTTGPAWVTDYVLGDHFLGAGYVLAAVAGTPSITVPVGDAKGLPLGLTFMGPAYSEPEILGFAYALEQLTNARRPPAFTPTLGAE